MNNDINKEDQEQEYVDDGTGILIDEFLKIHDPDNGEVLYEGRV